MTEKTYIILNADYGILKPFDCTGLEEIYDNGDYEELKSHIECAAGEMLKNEEIDTLSDAADEILVYERVDKIGKQDIEDWIDKHLKEIEKTEANKQYELYLELKKKFEKGEPK
mgnify:CR=1 FL=1